MLVKGGGRKGGNRGVEVGSREERGGRKELKKKGGKVKVSGRGRG